MFKNFRSLKSIPINLVLTLAATTVVIGGTILPALSSEGILRASDAQAQINLRSRASSNAQKLGYGIVGDRVKILDQTVGDDKYTWYKVRFLKSGAEGWIRGSFVQVVNTQRTGVLRADDSKAQINLRESPNSTSRKLGYGVVGDRVAVLDQTVGDDNYTWYRVRFSKSGAVGWIRGTFIRVSE